MRVLQINITCGVGSTGKIAVDIGKTLKEEGHKSFIGYGFYDTKEEDTFRTTKIGNVHIVRLEMIKCRLSGYFGFTNKRGTKRLGEWIEEVSPDIIHLHNIHGGYVHIEELFKILKRANVPVVWTLHDCWSFTGHCSHFISVNCDKWKTGCFKCPEKTNYPKRYFFDRSKEQYKRKKEAFTSLDNVTLITPSEWLSQLVKESFLNKYPVKVIHNGVDLSVFKPTENIIKKELGIEDKKMILGVQMTWSERKGLSIIKEIAKKLPKDCKLVLVGLNKRQIEEMPRNIIGLGRTRNQEELAKFYTAADVFINTSLEESFGLVNVEAVACGTPVVTFKSGGTGETVLPGCGTVVERKDADVMLNAIQNILNEDAYSACMSAREKFDKHKLYKEYIDTYLKIAANEGIK